MPEVSPTFDLPPGYVRASAYSEQDVARLGVPRGLVRHAPTEAPASLDRSDQIDAMQARLEALREESASPGTGLGPRARFRFQAHGTEREIDPPSNLTSDPSTSRRAGAVRKTRQTTVLRRWALVLAIGAAAAAAGYWLGRPAFDEQEASRANDVTGFGRPGWTPADREKLAAILAAETSARPRDAVELSGQLAANRPHLTGTAVLKARACLAARLYADAEVNLERARSAGTGDQSEIAYLRATNFGRQRKLEEMKTSLADAIAADPLRAEFYFARAEIDRRLGLVDDALAWYTKALERVRPGRYPSSALISFRRRLLLIEGGREAEIDTAVYQTELAKPAAAGDWLLTAAAVALQRRDLAEASKWLQRARASMPGQEYLEHIDDYFFRVHAGHADLKGVFPSPAERARFLASSRRAIVDP